MSQTNNTTRVNLNNSRDDTISSRNEDGIPDLVQQIAELRFQSSRFTIPAFRGEPKESITDFFQSFELLANAENWEPIDLLRRLPLFLKGAAAETWREFTEAGNHTFDEYNTKRS